MRALKRVLAAADRAWLRRVILLLGLTVGWSSWGQDGFVSIFNGRDLEGWDGKPGWWYVEDGAITAESTPEKPCTKHNYLIWRGGEPSDFELRFEFRIQGGNSGLQFRSREVEDWDMRGYQADIEAGTEWTGALFEHERGGIAMRGQSVIIAANGQKETTSFATAAELFQHIHTDDWNQYRIVARGPEIQLFINGVKMSQAVDRQEGQAAARGLIGLQMHPGPPMKVQFRNLKLKEFTAADRATPPEKLTVPPGFQVELVYAPNRETEGSWVSMCVDDQGRLLFSGQYDEGLYRLTPPPLGADPARTRVEKINVDLSGAQGLCWAFDSLYALVSKNGKTPSGLYRVRDTNGDDQLDTVELLRGLGGGGDHGWHGVLPGPDGQSIYVIAGNQTVPPTLKASRVPLHWGEDQLLRRLPDAGGFMTEALAPGGVVYRVSPNGQDWEMVASGFRNIYDAAFDRNGELFTYDADMEWDVGAPWYRPTRICHVTSGAEFGWRNGSGKWPAYYPDSVPGILNIGPGSPTGVAFGFGARFPERYQNALFVGDWTFGRIYAIHLANEGATYRGAAEVFLSGVPLPVVAIANHPRDHALYFITGGWRIQTGVYRVTYAGTEATPTITAKPALTTAQQTRLKLEALHGHASEGAVDFLWPYLGDADRTLRYAARVALEWQPVSTWRERALSATDPATAMTALLALSRVSSQDEFHRQSTDPAPDLALQRQILTALDRLDWTRLTAEQQSDLLRNYAVCLTRFGLPEAAQQQKLLAHLEPWFPGKTREVNSQLCELLVYLQSPRVAAVAVRLLQEAPTQEEQMDLAKSLRALKTGWTPQLRRDYFGWFQTAAAYRGGASFRGFIKMIKNDALANLTPAERDALQDVLTTPETPGNEASKYFAGRQATDWTVAMLAGALTTDLQKRDFERGRKMFSAASCFQCHAVAGEGGAVGPDLTRVAGRFSPRELLESIIEPNRAVSDLYQNVRITKRDGDVVVGRIVYHLPDGAVNVNPNMFDPAQVIAVKRSDMVKIEPSPVSPMPEGLLSPLHQDEIFDLLAYLLSGGDATNPMFKTGANAPKTSAN
ncbi:MAG: DUF1080 domain-containing protein [Verrucomicrobiae bacterium]|nr:DUF1080 domain-containing protein [Verrucomicrobiae bacterium]